MISTPTRRLLVLGAAFLAGVAVCASVVMAQPSANPADMDVDVPRSSCSSGASSCR